MDAKRPCTDSAISLGGFFERQNLPSSAREQCDEYARSWGACLQVGQRGVVTTTATTTRRREGAAIVFEPVQFQGYCSYTLSTRNIDSGNDNDTNGGVRDSLLIQFRPVAHAIDIDMAVAARRIYGALTPETKMIGTLMLGEKNLELMVYSLSRIRGISLLELRQQHVQEDRNAPTPPSLPQVRTMIATKTDRYAANSRERLVRDLAQFYATSLQAQQCSQQRQQQKRGLVGSSLRVRLETMHRSLPRRFRPFVRSAMEDLQDIQDQLPWVLTHGDFLPANIIVCPSGSNPGALAGIIDWAEAEYLPFGVGMYGLEEVLGEEQQHTQEQTPERPRFRYYDDEPKLRTLFWEELAAALYSEPGSGARDGGYDDDDDNDDDNDGLKQPQFLDLAKRAQALGVLLWHGVAFDDGALDRGCEQGRDDGEIVKLDAFFFSSSPPSSMSSSAGSVVIERYVSAPSAGKRRRSPGVQEPKAGCYGMVSGKKLSSKFFGRRRRYGKSRPKVMGEPDPDLEGDER
ncbi:phosphotransferase [Microdochium nivale]|nr:phosphotransferase [Microdochium nivale]